MDNIPVHEVSHRDCLQAPTPSPHKEIFLARPSALPSYLGNFLETLPTFFAHQVSLEILRW